MERTEGVYAIVSGYCEDPKIKVDKETGEATPVTSVVFRGGREYIKLVDHAQVAALQHGAFCVILCNVRQFKDQKYLGFGRVLIAGDEESALNIIAPKKPAAVTPARAPAAAK